MRVGVIGLGFAAHVHVPALRACPGIEIVAIAGSTVERACVMAKKLGIDHAHGGFEALLRRDDLDAVTMALPPAINAEALALAIERHVPVLCEKPMSPSGEASMKLADAATGLTTAVDFMFAELETFKRLRNLVRTGALGRLLNVRVTWTAQSYAQRHQQWSWKTDALRGGGVLAMLGSHFAFLVEWLLGATEVVAVDLSADATRQFAPAGSTVAEDTTKMILRTSEGVDIDVLLSNSKVGVPLHRWVIEGESATAILENAGADYVAGFRLSRNAPRADAELISREPTSDGDNRHIAMLPLVRRFIDGVRAGTITQPDLMAGARVDWVLDDIRSHASSRTKVTAAVR